jgi:hypothetical protein
MYSAATFRMRAAIDLSALEWLPKLAFAAALLAWLATAFGLAHQGVSVAPVLRARRAGAQDD